MRYLTLLLFALVLIVCSQHMQTSNAKAQASYDQSAAIKCVPLIEKESEEHLSSIEVTHEYFMAHSSGQMFQYMSEKANEGNSFGQLNLGIMFYEGGNGVKKDKVKAMLWLSRATDNGSKAAECILRLM